MKKKIAHLPRIARYLTVILLMTSLSMPTAQAQPDENGGEPTSSDVPLDMGIAWLAAGGLAYGCRKIGKKRRRNLSP